MARGPSLWPLAVGLWRLPCGDLAYGYLAVWPWLMAAQASGDAQAYGYLATLEVATWLMAICLRPEVVAMAEERKRVEERRESNCHSMFRKVEKRIVASECSVS